MNKLYVSAINQLCVEKNLPRNLVLEAVQAAIKTAYKKDFGNKDQNIDVDLDEENGSFAVYLVLNVVDKITTVEEDEEANPEEQILVPDAKKYKKDAKVGDVLRIDVTPTGFGRIAAQAAKQVILQRIQDAEREVVYEAFKEREDELIAAQVSKVDKGTLYLELDRNTVVLPWEERVPAEQFSVGQRIKVYLEKVERTPKGPRLLLSRKSPKLVEKLFEFEIPEVKAKIVEVKGVAREAGVRTKIAVVSHDPKVDPVGACVGQKGVRIQTIMDEVNREMIDVVSYSDDIEKYIANALAPAKTAVMKLNRDKKVADVYVASEMRPLAIGKAGQNVRLASILTGYEINLHDLGEYLEKEGAVVAKPIVIEEADAEATEKPAKKAKAEKKAPAKKAKKAATADDLSDLDVSDAIKKKLVAGGVTTVDVIKKMTAEDLTMIGGIGKAAAVKIKEAAENV